MSLKESIKKKGNKDNKEGHVEEGSEKKIKRGMTIKAGKRLTSHSLEKM